jgi:DGQHR domain-containing protein
MIAKLASCMVQLSVPAAPVHQGIEFFSGVITAGQLVDHYKVDRWNRSTNPSGYQRAEDERKMEEFKEYLLNGELAEHHLNPLDQTILVNIRGSWKYIDGFLHIDGELFVVDGQHRAGGLKLACAEDPDIRAYTIPVILMNRDVDAERARFFVINEKAKSVQTDLAERQLLEVHPEVARLVKSRFDEPKVRKALSVVDDLNASSEVWKDRIVIRGAE